MLRERLAVTLLLLPLALWVIADGSWLYLAAIGLVLALAAAEFALLFRRHGFAGGVLQDPSPARNVLPLGLPDALICGTPTAATAMLDAITWEPNDPEAMLAAGTPDPTFVPEIPTIALS